jgi:NAD(P)-dependent dehydrogenase (short-subunit alcohol dehydrogenase family)
VAAVVYTGYGGLLLSPPAKFTNKKIMITGAGRGVGKRLALGFGRLGARIALIGRNRGELDIAQIEIEQNGGSALRVEADVTDQEQLRVAVDRIGVVFGGGPDLLVCAAAVTGPLAAFSPATLKDWTRTIDVNLMGVVNACSAVLPSMLERGRGKIVILACGSDAVATRNMSAYQTSKTALVRFAESIAAELVDYNIQINCFDPGPTYTCLTDEVINAEGVLDSKLVEAARETRSTGGTSPELQMEHAIFLASEASNHISGKLVQVTDDWKKLRNAHLRPDSFALRRVSK